MERCGDSLYLDSLHLTNVNTLIKNLVAKCINGIYIVWLPSIYPSLKEVEVSTNTSEIQILNNFRRIMKLRYNFNQDQDVINIGYPSSINIYCPLKLMKRKYCLGLRREVLNVSCVLDSQSELV